ncbi:MAG: D-hexose-6-phosphate mutarotase [Pseudomonadota bacterium]
MTVVTPVQFGAMAALQIDAPDGARAIVTLYGAHLVSWKGANGREHLFCSTRSALDGRRAIRGGVPVIFPQFAERGSGMRHGFARVSQWRPGESGMQAGEAWAAFHLSHADLAPAQAQAWPQRFELVLRVALSANQLRMSLDVRNDGETAFEFSSALHSYLAVDDLGAVRIDGVQDGSLAIDGKLDQIFRGIGGAITLHAGAASLQLEQDGFCDAVVWNPGAADTAALADMEDDDYLRFVCIEPALIGPLELAPGASWQGRHQIIAGE